MEAVLVVEVSFSSSVLYATSSGFYIPLQQCKSSAVGDQSKHGPIFLTTLWLKYYHCVLLLFVFSNISREMSFNLLDPSVAHCILSKPDQFWVTCPSIRKSNISQSVYHAKNTRRVVNGTKAFTFCASYFFASTVIYCHNRRLFTTSLEICVLLFMGEHNVYNANHDIWL